MSCSENVYVLCHTIKKQGGITSPRKRRGRPHGGEACEMDFSEKKYGNKDHIGQLVPKLSITKEYFYCLSLLLFSVAVKMPLS